MTALQHIIKEAKNLREKYPNKHPKWTDYVKEASKIHNKDKKISGYVKTKRTGNLTNVIYTKLDKKKAAPKKAAPKKAGPKKAAPKKIVVKKTIYKKKAAAKKIQYKKQGVLFGVKKLHKDTKSHNVNIRVVSGIDKKIGQINLMAIEDYKKSCALLNKFEKIKINYKTFINNKKNKLTDILIVKKQLIGLDKYINELKIHNKELKKII